jgi:hypothetical protein
MILKQQPFFEFFPIRIPNKYFGLLGFFLLSAQLLAQEYLVIEKLEISGNSWTRDYIIEGELDFSEGDTILLATMASRFDDNRNRLLNTGLFNLVEINLTAWKINEHRANVEIKLVENWFWYPVPVLELADRSFNEWLYQHDASLKRLNLGIRFMHINLSGNLDKFKFTYHTGFTQKFEVDYTFPYLNPKKNLGAYLNLLYVTHKEIPFETRNNQLQFIRIDDHPLLTRFRTSLGLKYRKSKSTYHNIYLEYHQKSLSDTISKDLNPAYFNPFQGDIRHISFHYRYRFTKVDKKIYPTKGERLIIDFRKDGFGLFDELNHLYFMAGFEQHFKFSNRFSSGFKIKGRKGVTFKGEVPYSYLPGMGYYDDVLNGYQLYVIDGLDFIYLKTFQKIMLADLKYDFKSNMPFKAFKTLPLKIYLGIHGDLGYVYEPRFAEFNPFNNRLLTGVALSLDLLIYENYFLSCAFTLNHTGETGIFFQGINTFE